jgi:hypothetical protein
MSMIMRGNLVCIKVMMIMILMMMMVMMMMRIIMVMMVMMMMIMMMMMMMMVVMMMMMMMLTTKVTIMMMMMRILMVIMMTTMIMMMFRCEWIRSERFAKKQKEEAKNREKNNPMKAESLPSLQSNHSYRGPTQLVQHFAARGEITSAKGRC